MDNLLGTTVRSLTDMLANYNIETNNTNQHHYIANLVRAKNVWLDLLKTTIWASMYKVLPVNKRDNTVTLPADMTRLFNLNIVDECNNIRPIGFNPDMNTLKLDCHTFSCSCENCKGAESLCDMMDQVQVVNETVMIEGYPFNRRTWIEKAAYGIINRVTENPYPEFPLTMPPVVNYITERETLCNCDVNEKNCLLPTRKNMELLRRHCGCVIPGLQKRRCEEEIFPRNDYGYWNWKANAHSKIELRDFRADNVIIYYQSNGDCSVDEIMVPLYALDAMQFGIVYRTAAFSRAFSATEKRAALLDYERAKFELLCLLSPVDVSAVSQLQDIVPKW
jgi:hypothetical protein